MSDFLGAFHIHIIPRIDVEAPIEAVNHAVREKLILLIAKICKDFRGTASEESQNTLIYGFDQVSFAVQAAMAIQIEADALNAKNPLDLRSDVHSEAKLP